MHVSGPHINYIKIVLVFDSQIRDSASLHSYPLTETNYAGHVYYGRKAFKIICIAQLIYEMLRLPKEKS